jgi:glycosyltransferase involved in cell wall biosynthesis
MANAAQKEGAAYVTVVGTPIARQFLEPPVSPLSNQFTSVCYAGRLAVEKNLPSILEAATHLPHIRFTIAGDGPLRDEVAKLAATRENVRWLGWVTREQVREVIDASQLLLLPSKVESFGTIALEAMARMRLVLISERCGMLEWPTLAKAACCLMPDESLKDALIRIAEIPPPQREHMAESALTAARTFNRQTLNDWSAVFSGLLKSRRGWEAPSLERRRHP